MHPLSFAEFPRNERAVLQSGLHIIAMVPAAGADLFGELNLVLLIREFGDVFAGFFDGHRRSPLLMA